MSPYARPAKKTRANEPKPHGNARWHRPKKAESWAEKAKRAEARRIKRNKRQRLKKAFMSGEEYAAHLERMRQWRAKQP